MLDARYSVLYHRAFAAGHHGWVVYFRYPLATLGFLLLDPHSVDVNRDRLRRAFLRRRGQLLFDFRHPRFRPSPLRQVRAYRFPGRGYRVRFLPWR